MGNRHSPTTGQYRPNQTNPAKNFLMTTELFEHLSSLQLSLQLVEELELLSEDTSNDLFNKCLTKLGIDHEEYYKQLEEELV